MSYEKAPPPSAPRRRSPAAGRLDRAGSAVVNALRILPVAGSPGYRSPGDLAADLSTILRNLLGPIERLTLASVALMAAQPDDRWALLQAAERGGRGGGWPFPGVDPEVFRRVSREYIRRNPLPPPPKGFDRFAECARTRLAAAWAEASDRDRRDLINRATGRTRA